MKLWIVIYVAGSFGGSFGPLPYDMKECQRRIVEEIHLDPNIITPNGYSARDVKFVCEWHETRPQIKFGK